MEVDADEEEEDGAVSLVKDVAGPGGRGLVAAIVEKSCDDVDALVPRAQGWAGYVAAGGLQSEGAVRVCMLPADIRKSVRSDGSAMSYPLRSAEWGAGEVIGG